AEIENIVLSNEEIADAAVVGKKDEIKGNVLVVFASLKQGFLPSEELKNKIMSEIKKNYGGIAVIDDIIFVDKLPKTRTGKIMRRVLRALINNEELGDLSTLEEREAIEDLRKRLGEKIGK
ncbi:MAG: acetyl-coenzyme A synthetase, partial [Acidianus sp.]